MGTPFLYATTVGINNREKRNESSEKSLIQGITLVPLPFFFITPYCHCNLRYVNFYRRWHVQMRPSDHCAASMSSILIKYNTTLYAYHFMRAFDYLFAARAQKVQHAYTSGRKSAMNAGEIWFDFVVSFTFRKTAACGPDFVYTLCTPMATTLSASASRRP